MSKPTLYGYHEPPPQEFEFELRNQDGSIEHRGTVTVAPEIEIRTELRVQLGQNRVTGSWTHRGANTSLRYPYQWVREVELALEDGVRLASERRGERSYSFSLTEITAPPRRLRVILSAGRQTFPIEFEISVPVLQRLELVLDDPDDFHPRSGVFVLQPFRIRAVFDRPVGEPRDNGLVIDVSPDGDQSMIAGNVDGPNALVTDRLMCVPRGAPEQHLPTFMEAHLPQPDVLHHAWPEGGLYTLRAGTVALELPVVDVVALVLRGPDGRALAAVARGEDPTHVPRLSREMLLACVLEVAVDHPSWGRVAVELLGDAGRVVGRFSPNRPITLAELPEMEGGGVWTLQVRPARSHRADVEPPVDKRLPLRLDVRVGPVVHLRERRLQLLRGETTTHDTHLHLEIDGDEPDRIVGELTIAEETEVGGAALSKSSTIILGRVHEPNLPAGRHVYHVQVAALDDGPSITSLQVRAGPDGPPITTTEVMIGSLRVEIHRVATHHFAASRGCMWAILQVDGSDDRTFRFSRITWSFETPFGEVVLTGTYEGAADLDAVLQEDHDRLRRFAFFIRPQELQSLPKSASKPEGEPPELDLAPFRHGDVRLRLEVAGGFVAGTPAGSLALADPSVSVQQATAWAPTPTTLWTKDIPVGQTGAPLERSFRLLESGYGLLGSLTNNGRKTWKTVGDRRLPGLPGPFIYRSYARASNASPRPDVKERNELEWLSLNNFINGDVDVEIGAKAIEATIQIEPTSGLEDPHARGMAGVGGDRSYWGIEHATLRIDVQGDVLFAIFGVDRPCLPPFRDFEAFEEFVSRSLDDVHGSLVTEIAPRFSQTNNTHAVVSDAPAASLLERGYAAAAALVKAYWKVGLPKFEMLETALDLFNQLVLPDHVQELLEEHPTAWDPERDPRAFNGTAGTLQPRLFSSPGGVRFGAVPTTHTPSRTFSGLDTRAVEAPDDQGPLAVSLDLHPGHLYLYSLQPRVCLWGGTHSSSDAEVVELSARMTLEGGTTWRLVLDGP